MSSARVAAELEALCRPGGPLHVDATGATWRRHAIGEDPYAARYLPARVRLHAELVEEFRAQSTDVAVDGLAAVVTAGPPAVGKSTRLGELGYDATWRRIDPDDFKTRLIEHDLRGGDLALPEQLADLILSDHLGVMPMELAGLYHRESTVLADKAEEISLAARENVIIEGTLAWDDLAAQVVKDLTRHNYRYLDVVLVEVSLRTALEQALKRWWSDRKRGGLGGRFTPTIAIQSLYLSETTTMCAGNARGLVQRAQAAGIQATLKH